MGLVFADCVHLLHLQLLITKFRLKLKKTGKNIRTARYDLNQIPYEFTVEVTHRFKGPGLDNSVPEELWTEVRKASSDNHFAFLLFFFFGMALFTAS